MNKSCRIGIAIIYIMLFVISFLVGWNAAVKSNMKNIHEKDLIMKDLVLEINQLEKVISGLMEIDEMIKGGK